MDHAYRSELRELNELNFSRFEARLDQRLAELEAKLVRWTFVFWAPTALGIVGLLIAFLLRSPG
jgi:hypothetical protein